MTFKRKIILSQNLFLLIVLIICCIIAVFFQFTNLIIVLGNRLPQIRQVNEISYEYTNNQMIQNSYLKIFDKRRFEEERNQDIQASNTCIKSGLKPQFTICVHELTNDIYVSHRILKSGIWEKEISELIKDILLRHDQKDIIFLDVGANLGFHSLYAAKLGYNVCAVEPQQRNFIKMFRSALKSGISDKLTIIQNAISDNRRTGYMNIDQKNNGGSFLELDTNQSLNTKTKNQNLSKNMLQTVLLKDVIDAMPKTNVVSTPLSVLMKIDIEHFECRAFLGSPEILRQNQTISLLAVIMEWTFEGQNGSFSEACPKDKVIDLTKLFLENGFTPFQWKEGLNRVFYGNEWEKLDISNFGVDWSANVLWKRVTTQQSV